MNLLYAYFFTFLSIAVLQCAQDDFQSNPLKRVISNPEMALAAPKEPRLDVIDFKGIPVQADQDSEAIALAKKRLPKKSHSNILAILAHRQNTGQFKPIKHEKVFRLLSFAPRIARALKGPSFKDEGPSPKDLNIFAVRNNFFNRQEFTLQDVFDYWKKNPDSKQAFLTKNPSEEHLQFVLTKPSLKDHRPWGTDEQQTIRWLWLRTAYQSDENVASLGYLWEAYRKFAQAPTPDAAVAAISDITELVQKAVSPRHEDSGEPVGGKYCPRVLALVPDEIIQYIDTLDLSALGLNDNRIPNDAAGFPHKYLKRFAYLEELNLAENALCRLPHVVTTFKNLLTLDLSSNSLEEANCLQGIEELSQLQILNLRFNQLTVIPDEVFELPNLTNLDISMNPCMKISVPKGDAIFPKLKQFVVGDAGKKLNFEEIFTQVRSLTQLEVLDISHTAVWENSPASFKLNNGRVLKFNSAHNYYERY
jgi:hypothetical protein